MNLNLSSEIVLTKIPVEIYRPKTAIDRSELTRYEKIPTNIFAKEEEGVKHVAENIAAIIKNNSKKKASSVYLVWVQVCRSHLFSKS